MKTKESIIIIIAAWKVRLIMGALGLLLYLAVQGVLAMWGWYDPGPRIAREWEYNGRLLFEDDQGRQGRFEKRRFQ
jgi:hypothetical protein